MKSIKLTGGPDNIEYDSLRKVYYAGGIGKILDHMSYVQHFNVQGTVNQNASFWAFADSIDEDTLEVTNLISGNHIIKGCSSAYSLDKGDKLVLGSWTDKAPVICKKKR